jgi:hypothetical protein
MGRVLLHNCYYIAVSCITLFCPCWPGVHSSGGLCLRLPRKLKLQLHRPHQVSKAPYRTTCSILCITISFLSISVVDPDVQGF